MVPVAWAEEPGRPKYFTHTHVCVRTLHTLGAGHRPQGPRIASGKRGQRLLRRQGFLPGPQASGSSSGTHSVLLLSPGFPSPFLSQASLEVSATKIKSFQRAALVLEMNSALPSCPVRVLMLEPEVYKGGSPAHSQARSLLLGCGRPCPRAKGREGCSTRATELCPAVCSSTAEEAVSISQAPLGSLPLMVCEGDSHWGSSSSSDTVEVRG